MFHPPASAWSRPAHAHAPHQAWTPWQQAPRGHHAAPSQHYFVPPPAQPQHAMAYRTPRRAPAPPALYVLGSFALMMVLAAMTSVFGSVATLALMDETGDDETTEVAPPAASLSTR